MSPPDLSFFYALDTPASSTQSSLGNLLSESALVRLVSGSSQNQLVEHDSSTPSTSFNQLSPEIRSPPKVKRCTLRRKTPPIPPFLPIQTPPDSPILVEPRESSSGGNFVFYLDTAEPSTTNRRVSRQSVQSQAYPSMSTTSGFPRSPSQEFHTCDEQSPGLVPGHSSPISPSTPPMYLPLGKDTPNLRSSSPSLFADGTGGSPLFAHTSGSRDLTVPRRGSTTYGEDVLGGQSPTLLVSSSTSAIAGAKLVPFSASARASVVSESPSYTSEYAYQGGMSPTVPYELEEYYDHVGPEAILPAPDKTESQVHRNGRGQTSSSSPDPISYVDGGDIEPSSSGLGRKQSPCVPGALFPIPEEDTQTESSGSRSRSDPSLSSSESVKVSAASSLPLTSSSSYGEFALSFVSTSGSFRIVNHSTPGASAAVRPTHTATGSLPATNTIAQTTLRGTPISGTSPHTVGTLRVGARESYPGSGDLNDRTEMSGACMNGLYEELEEWGCEWILQNQVQQSGPSTGRT